MYYGEDEVGDDKEVAANSPGGIVIESLSNIRTVASLTLEDKKAAEYAQALAKEHPHLIKTNVLKGECTLVAVQFQSWIFSLFCILAGAAAGLGQFV